MQKFNPSKTTKKRKNNPDALLYRHHGNLKKKRFETLLIKPHNIKLFKSKARNYINHYITPKLL